MRRSLFPPLSLRGLTAGTRPVLGALAVSGLTLLACSWLALGFGTAVGSPEGPNGKRAVFAAVPAPRTPHAAVPKAAATKQQAPARTPTRAVRTVRPAVNSPAVPAEAENTPVAPAEPTPAPAVDQPGPAAVPPHAAAPVEIAVPAPPALPDSLLPVETPDPTVVVAEVLALP